MSRKLALQNLQIFTNKAINSSTASLIVNCSQLDKGSMYFKVTGTTTVSTAVKIFICQDAAGTNPYELQGLSASIAAGDTSMEIYFTELPFSYMYATLTNGTDTTMTVNCWFNGKMVGG